MEMRSEAKTGLAFEKRRNDLIWLGLALIGSAKAKMGRATQGIAEDKQWICLELQGSGRAKR